MHSTDAADAAGVKQFELVRQKRFARDGHERFGDFFRDGPQSRGESARENGDGNVERGAHEINSLVPSKSNRKRTSLQPGLPHGVTQSGLVLRIKHEETATARADELAAERAVGHRQVIPLVDFRIAHAPAALLFALPVHIHQPRELMQVAGFQRAAGFAGQGL